MSSDNLAYNEYSGRRQTISLERHRVCKLGLEMLYEVKPVKKVRLWISQASCFVVFGFFFNSATVSKIHYLLCVCVCIHVWAQVTHILMCACVHIYDKNLD